MPFAETEKWNPESNVISEQMNQKRSAVRPSALTSALEAPALTSNLVPAPPKIVAPSKREFSLALPERGNPTERYAEVFSPRRLARMVSAPNEYAKRLSLKKKSKKYIFF